MRGESPRTLCALGTSRYGQIRAATFAPGDGEGWLRRQDAAGANLYFVPNDLEANCVSRKPKESEVVAARWLQVDIDPRAPDPDEPSVAAFLASEQARILA